MSKRITKTVKNGPKRGRSPWQRPWLMHHGPIASFFLIGEKVAIQCEYSPIRVRLIKSIPGATYLGDRKEWRIPASALPELLSRKEFPATQMIRAFPRSGIQQQNLSSESLAYDELRANPFSVREGVICALPVELILRSDPGRGRTFALPSYSSQAKKLVEATTGALFSPFDSAYTIPTDRIAGLLKSLRESRVLFAVDIETGTALKETAELRARILENPKTATGDELKQALLTPFVAKVWEEAGACYRYRPCFFTTEQFKVAFPGIRRPAKTEGAEPAAPFTLDESGLLHLVGKFSQIPFTIWLTAECHTVVEQERQRIQGQLTQISGPLADSVADVISVPALWRMDGSGHAILQLATGHIAQEVREQKGTTFANSLYSLVAPQLGLLATPPDTPVALSIRESLLLSIVHEVEIFCVSHSVPPPPQTERFAHYLKDVRERVALRERSALYTSLEDVIPSELPQLDPKNTARLFPHQRVAIKWLMESPVAFLGDDMGLGKTLSVLSYFEALRNSDGFQLLLVVCPNSLTRNWLREINQWYPDTRGVVLSGDRGEKTWALRLLTSNSVAIDALIINYEAVRLDYITPEITRLCGQHKTLLCLDESQRVKNHTSKTFKAISELAPHCPRRVLLSGTPTPKDVTDLWAQMRILDGGIRFGKSFYRWLETIAELGSEYSDYTVTKFREKEVKESVLRVHEIMLRRKKERVVSLPEKTFVVREIALSGAQKKQYDEIRESLILRVRTTTGEQFVREITNILEEYLRAVQVASNPRLLDPEWKGTPAKFGELDEIVNEVVREGEQKIVIWSNYLGNIRELKERYKELGAEMFSGDVSAQDRAVIVRRFQEEDTPRVLIAVPAAGGVGITLTRAQTAVYLDKTWNAEHWMQSVDRIHRIGQTGTVTVISLIASKVDEMIHWNLRRKERSQAEILGDRGGKSSGFRSPTREELLQALEE